MRPRALVSLAAGAALFLSAGRALAEEEDPGMRVRLGASAGAGAFIVPGGVVEASFNGQFQAGLQFNNVIGLYAVFDGLPGLGADDRSGQYSAVALLAELTFRARISVAAGLEVGRYYPSSLLMAGQPVPHSDFLYGGMLHFAWHPLSGYPPERHEWSSWICQRYLITVGLDLRLLGGKAGVGALLNRFGTTPGNNFALAPTLSLGAVVQ